jgi:hypothetical protein
VFQVLECIELNMIDEKVVTFNFDKETPKPLSTLPTQHAHGQPTKAPPQKGKGFEQESKGDFSSYFVEQKGEEKCWRCGRLHHKRDCPNLLQRTINNPNPTNLVLIARFMVMTWTIVLHYILNSNKLSPKQVMWGNHKVLTRSKRERVQPRVD